MKGEDLLKAVLDGLTYTPTIVNPKNESYNSFVVMGMGGSMISGRLLRSLFPDLDVRVHNDYGEPSKLMLSNGPLMIASSYSGLTEETIDAYEKCRARGLPVAVLESGGSLLEQAKVLGDMYVTLPHTGLEPRFTIFYQIAAILTMARKLPELEALRRAASQLNHEAIHKDAERLSSLLNGRYTLLYSSSHYEPLTYIWKAAINEGMKLPCFNNVFSEHNHNELEQFSSLTKEERSTFLALFTSSPFDHPRILKRFEIVEKLLSSNGIAHEHFRLDMYGEDRLVQVISHVLVGYLGITQAAERRGVDPFKTPTIAALKEALKM